MVIVQEGLFIQVGEYLLDDRRMFNAGDHLDGAAALFAGFNFDPEQASASKADV